MLADLPGTIRKMGVDAAELTPTVAGTLLKNREAAPCLQLLLTIGEMLSKPVIEEFGESATRPGILYAMYGPTEASIHCTIATRVETLSSIHNIGRPLATVTAIIIDTSAEKSSAQSSILPKGQVGELAIAGQLASGYLNRPEQTTAAFVNLAGHGMFYRTGDRARIADGGTLEMLGRITSGQVKLRGQRVELGEIESVACRVGGVVMAAASIINDALVLFCVQDGSLTTAANIRETCKRHLLNFMVPGDVVLLELDSLPRLPSGKMDRKKIETNYLRVNNAGTNRDAAPLDPATAQICKRVSEELGHQISPTTPLWAEGLNSLMAIKVASILRVDKIGVSVRDLLELETIADIVANIKAQSQEPEAEARELSKSVLVEDTEIWQHIQKTVRTTLGGNKIAHILPCNAIQVAMLTETLSNIKLNFNSIELEVVPSITFHDIRVAMQDLARKNEILRSGFLSIDHHSMPFAQVVWHELDLDRDLSLLSPLNIKLVEDCTNRFVVQIHHALYDGWSWDIIMADLNDLLAKQPNLERPQFRFVNREQRRLPNAQQEAAEDYWRRILLTTTPFRLPQLNPRVDTPSKHLIERRTLQTSSPALSAFSLRLHVSPQTVLSTALSLLLGSYTDSSNVIFGLVSSGRHLPLPEIERVIGPCFSTLPLSLDLSKMRTIQDVLLYVHGLELGQLEHGILSLRDILAAAGVSPQQKFFDTLFVWQKSLSSSQCKNQLVKVTETHDCLKYTLVIEAEPFEHEVIVKLSYDEARLSPLHANCFLAQLDHLLAAIVADEEKSLLDVWDACDSSILAVANVKSRVFDTTFDFTSTVRDLAKERPKSIAISFTHDFDPETGAAHVEELTYGELWAQSNLLAHSLQSLDLGVDDIVCVLVDKCLDLYVLDFAIIVAGGAFLNVDTRTPSERIRQILREVKCKLVITDNKEAFPRAPDTVEVSSVPLHRVKSNALQYRRKDFSPRAKVDGSHLAYAVMTSGTTGNPKAILVTRENLFSNIDILSRTYPRYNEQDVLLQACSPAFDVFVFELFWTWHMGMCLSSSSNDVLFRDIEGFVRAAEVSHLSLTPSVAALIHPDNVPDVKFLVTAGEPMNSKVFANWACRGLFQGYGPAETTNICNVRGPVRRDDMINNVGAPFPNTSIFICAKHGNDDSETDVQILPIGAVGEVVIGGDQVARGYADHSLTARSFIDTKYGRLYRSGDIGRLLASGDLIVLGREDDQVKLRGQRIELGDINTAITRVPFVKDAVTLIVGENHPNARLVSFWIANTEYGPLDPGLEIYELLEAILPSYMVPESLVPMDAMPLTRQGKIDKPALLQHYKSLDIADLQQLSRDAVTSNAHEHFTDEEKLIAQALSEVTDTPVADIKPSTSFYSLGLDSISSVRLSRKLRQAGLGQVDVSLILKHCSVQRLRRALTNPASILEIKSDSRKLREVFQPRWRSMIMKKVDANGQLVEKIMPCTAMQESVLVSQANNPKSATYQARMEFEVGGDADRLCAAWSHLVKRHQILRTGFALTPSADHAYAQIVLKDFELPCFTSEEESSMYSIKSKGSIIPPWRLILNKVCSGEPVLLTLIMSHALYDFEALALLLKDLELKYQERELTPVVSPDAYSSYMMNMNLGEVDAFWQSRLNGYKPGSFSGLFQTTELHAITLSTSIRISQVSRRNLLAAAEQASATSTTLLQAAWVRLLSCYMATEDVVFGNVFSGRNLSIEGVTHIIAPLFNTLPVRIRVTGRQDMRDLTAKIQTAVLEMLPYQPSALRRIVRNQKLGGQPLFDTLILVQSGGLTLDESIWSLRKEDGEMEFPGVIMEIMPDVIKDCLIFKLHVQSENIDSSTAQQILRHYDVLLDEILQYPQAQVTNFASIDSDLPLLHSSTDTGQKTPGPAPANIIQNADEEALTDLELSVRELFARFSGIDTIKIQRSTNIFEIGLDSLHVVQIASELRELGHNVTGADVLEAQTIDRLSRTCMMAAKEEIHLSTMSFDLQAFDQKHRDAVCEQLDLKNRDIQAVRPCTSTQAGILAEFNNSKGELYFNSICLELPAGVNLAHLKYAWQIVMNRNEILRTGFATLNLSGHAYAMITYVDGARDLPWLVDEKSERAKTRNLSKLCFQNLHNPCWCLLLKKQTGSHRLEIHLLHSLYDANSLDGLLSEVAAIYQNQDLKLPDAVPMAPALRAILDQSEASCEDSEEFWRTLGTAAQPSRFPNLNIRQYVERDSITVSKSSYSLLPALENGCRRLGVTLQSVCQIAWARLLAAYTGERKVIFGIVLSGRTLPNTAHVRFPTINTVPFSIEVGDGIHDMLEEATEINVGLYKHQFTPITAIKRWLDVEGKLFDTILVLQKTQPAQADYRPWVMVDDSAAAEYAISMEVLPQINGHVELRITARLDTMPQGHARILLSQYEALLQETVQENLGAQLMPPSLRSIVTAKDAYISTDIRLLHDFVESTSRRTPDAIALEFVYSIANEHVEKRCWTYKQLNEESNRMAHLLLAFGAKPRDFVAICFDKCPEASFAILAVLKAGCAYVAIDPAAPVARKEFILEDAKCKMLLTTRSLFFTLENGGKTTMLAVDDQDLVQRHLTTNLALEREVQPSDICYCLYTSGTTGQPKGCLITHASGVQAMLSFQRIFAGHWDVNSRWLQFASFHFDVSVLEQYWSWSVGICVTSAPRDVLFEDIPGAIDALQITHLDLTPSLARLLTPEQVPSLCRGVFIVGGEQVTQDIIDAWSDAGCLYNFYGPSEVTIGCTVHERVKGGVKSTNIGQPWDNVGAFVLEPGSEIPVLRGAIGELCLSGPLVGKGYLNRPELTAEKFVTLKEYNVRVYRSGDFVRLLHDNSFEFLGRIDDQVKLRGQRLEIREIDHAIKKASASVVDVATLVMKHANQPSEQLIAFFTTRGKDRKSSEIMALTSSDAESVVSQVRRRLQDMLPAYMVPIHLLPISHIPLSANNKADLKALKAYFVAMPVRPLQNMDWNGSNIVPMTEITRKVIKILVKFLGVAELTISPSSRLFELGLDSISAVAFASVLRKEGFGSADAATVMRRPIVADLAYELNASEGNDYDHAVEMAKNDIDHFRGAHGERISSLTQVESFWPCTPLQEDMLSKTTHRGDTPYYLSAFHYTLDMSVGLDTVKYAWTEAQRSFPILRTTFVEVSNKQHVQVVRRHCVAPVCHYTLVPGEDTLTVLNQRASEWCNKVDVLGNEPCWEMEVLKTSTGQLHMSLRIFHGLYDANSLSIMLNYVAHLIRKSTTQPGKHSIAFHQALPYGPLCHRARAEEFWISRFSLPALLDLSPIDDGFSELPITYSIELALPRGYVATRNKLAVTDSAIFQAANLLSLQSKYGIFPTLGVVVSGRSFPMTGVEEICGPLFNTIPTHILPKANWSCGDLIRACHDFNVDSKPFEHTSLREIRRWAGLDPGGTLFDVLFVFQKERRDAADKNEDLWKEVGQTTTLDYPLNIEVNLKKDLFKLTLVGDPEFLGENDLYSLSLKFLSSFEQLIGGLDELLLSKEGYRMITRQVKPAELVRHQRTFDHSILQQVRSEVTLLAQQDLSSLSDDVNLFSLGLDSISLIKLSGALKRCGMPISVNIIMRLSTPSNIAQYLTERQNRSVTAPKTEKDGGKLLKATQLELTGALLKQNVSLDHVEKVLPVTPMQEGVLANFNKYYHFALLKLSANTNLDRLRRAWNFAVLQNSILRTSFVAIDDPTTKHVFAQLIASPHENQWETKRINCESRLQDLVVEKSREMVEAGLDYPPFLINFLVATNSGNRYVLLGMSHAIYDGWSIQLLHKDIASLYNGQQVQHHPIEPYLQYIRSRPLRIARTFWTQQMSNYLPKPFSVPAIDGAAKPASHRMTLESRTQSLAIQRFCMERSITLQTLGLAIWTTVLASHLQQFDICFGVVLACRDTEDADQLMFPTFNTVPFRPRFNGGSHLELLEHIQQLSLQIAEHQDFPLKDIKKLHSKSPESFSELFDTLFVLQTRPASDEPFSNLYEEVDLGESPSLDYPVNVEMDMGERLVWTVAASAIVFDKEGVKILLERLESTLEAILQHPDGNAMEINEAESQPEAVSTQLVSTQFAMNLTKELDQLPLQATATKDAVLRDSIFNTIASVSRCSVDSLSGDTNIYGIGLDSISVIKLTSLLRKKGIALPVSKIVAAVTLDRIVSEAKRMGKPEKLIEPRAATTPSGADLPKAMQGYLAAQGISQTAIEAIIPASAGQIFMLDYYQASGRTLFYPTFKYSIHNVTISKDRIIPAWRTVVQAFPALRTRFIEENGKIWQVVIRPNVVDQYSPAAHLIVSQEPEGTIIGVRLHHALYDAVSLPMIISALEKACQGQVLQQHISENALLNFIEATRGDATSATRREFWTEYLRRAQIDYGGFSNTGTFTASRVEAIQENALADTDTRSLISCAAAAGVSLQALFLAAVARTYAHARFPTSQRDTVVLGVYLANRGLNIDDLDLDLEHLAAPTVNIVPLVVDVKGDVPESARRVQGDLVRIQRAENCGVTLREIHAWTGVRIEWFVNFVPRVEEGGGEDEDGDGDMYGDGDGDVSGSGSGREKLKLVVYPYENERRDEGEASSRRQTQDQIFTSPFLGEEPDMEVSWCVPSVDVEAKLEDGGGVTVGVFAPEDMLGEEGVRRMLGEIKEAFAVLMSEVR